MIPAWWGTTGPGRGVMEPGQERPPHVSLRSHLQRRPLRQLARQSTLSAAIDHRAVLGRQRHRRPPRRRAYSAGDTDVPALVVGVPCHSPVRLEASCARLGTIRSHLGTMIFLSIIGISAFNTLQYWALEHTTALNTLLLQSAGPLIVAVWSLVLFGVRLTLAQTGGGAPVPRGGAVFLAHG